MGIEGTWVAPHLRTTSWYLFKNRYLCKIPMIQSVSAEYISHFGTPASGDAEYDRETVNELIQRMLTIVEMAEFFKNGVTVRVCQPKDTKEIYERISDHLNFWKDKMATSFHTKDAPVEDLVLLDKLASAVYVHAVRHFTTEVPESLLARKMSSGMRVTRGAVMKPLVQASTPDNPTPKQKERVSMADTFRSTSNLPAPTSRWR